MAKITHYDFEFETPADWFDGSSVVWLGPAQGGYCPNVTITRDYFAQPRTSQMYSQGVLEAMKSEFEDSEYKVVAEYDLQISQDLPASSRIHSFHMDKIGMRICQWQVYAVREREAVTITCSDREENFAKSKPVFESIINSFNFIV
jgi:hypothetical protein